MHVFHGSPSPMTGVFCFAAAQCSCMAERDPIESPEFISEPSIPSRPVTSHSQACLGYFDTIETSMHHLLPCSASYVRIIYLRYPGRTWEVGHRRFSRGSQSIALNPARRMPATISIDFPSNIPDTRAGHLSPNREDREKSYKFRNPAFRCSRQSEGPRPRCDQEFPKTRARTASIDERN